MKRREFLRASAALTASPLTEPVARFFEARGGGKSVLGPFVFEEIPLEGKIEADLTWTDEDGIVFFERRRRVRSEFESAVGRAMEAMW